MNEPFFFQFQSYNCLRLNNVALFFPNKFKVLKNCALCSCVCDHATFKNHSKNSIEAIKHSYRSRLHEILCLIESIQCI